MEKTLQNVLLSKGFLVLETKISKTNEPALAYQDSRCATLLESFASLGFGLDTKGIEKIKYISDEDLTKFYFDSIQLLKETVGANVNTDIVFYDDYPNIDHISSLDRILNAFVHYLTVAIKDITDIDNVYVPNEKHDRLEFNEHVINKTLTVLSTLDDSELINKIIQNYLENSLYARRAIPETQKQTVIDAYNYVTNHNLMYHLDETKIVFNENKILYVKILMEYKYHEKTFNDLILNNPTLKIKCLSTFTDYLRLYRAISQDDSLNEFTSTLTDTIYYKSEPKAIRRWFLNNLNILSKRMPEEKIHDEIGRHKCEWIYVLENLHPGDYAKRYPMFYKYTDILRNSHLLTENHYIEKYYLEGNTDKLLEKLKENPGEFARRLDAMLRNSKLDRFKIIQSMDILEDVALSVLVQLHKHFMQQKVSNAQTDDRIFVIKTDRGEKIHVEADNRNPIVNRVLDSVITELEHIIYTKERPQLVEKFKDKKVYIDKSLLLYTLPENDRLISKSVKNVPFGSRMKLDTKNYNIVRLFTHWKNMDNDKGWGGRVDIDLSAHLISKDFKYIQEVSWRYVGGFNRQSDGIEFSGDITDAPNGANEFIDVNINSIKDKHPDVRYIVICNSVFTGQSYSEIPECFSGVMLRGNDGNTGKIFDARTVKTKFDLCQEGSTGNIAIALDLDTMEIICIDKAAHHCMSASVAGETNFYLTNMVKRAVSPSMSLYKLILNSLYNSNIQLVETREEADFIIDDSDKADLAPWNQEEISALFLS